MSEMLDDFISTAYGGQVSKREMSLTDFLGLLLESDNDQLQKLADMILDDRIRNQESLLSYLQDRNVCKDTVKELLNLIIDTDSRTARTHFSYFGFSKAELIDLLQQLVQIVPPQVKVKGKTETSSAKTQAHPKPQAAVHLSSLDLQRLYESVLKRQKLTVLAEGEIDVSANPVLTDQLPIGLQDEFCLDAAGHSFYPGSIALVDNQGKNVVAAGHLEENEAGETHLIFAAADVDYTYFRQQSQCKLLLFPADAGPILQQQPLPVDQVPQAYVYPLRVDFQELETTDRTLCIDFGTSNTTAGSYGIFPQDEETNELEIVEFIDKSGGQTVSRKMVPTIVYVQQIPQDAKQPPTYLFGYEALQKVRQEDYDTKASVFYEIKRWITDLDTTEDICDEEGHRGTVSHRDIIKAYLLFVIHTAEWQFFKKKFKTLHFTAPVKLKDSFITSLKDMFANEYIILNPMFSLDEGIAIVYQHIAEEVEGLEKDPNAGQPLPIMITDCGGGTTDLARCEYVYTDGEIPKLTITNDFENGDANFGGNNLTFRILQMLKVKMAHYQQTQQNISVKELIPDNEDEILEKIDAEKHAGWQAIYQTLEDEYQKAESLIPTRFADEKMQTKKQHVKRNFYYLWQLAEAYKKAFYQSQQDTVSLDFDRDQDLEIGIVDKELYYLYWRDEQGNLVKKDDPLQGLA